MRLLVVDYLASLKEREELDAILPDLLTELGFNVISKPRRGTTQRGVDIAAVRAVDGAEVLYLFSLKAGNLTRTEWNGPHAQALRPSLDEIRDSYLQSRVPPKHRNAKVVICLCFGGEINEDILDVVAGYMKANTTDRVTYDVWNGGRLADLLLEGLLREQVLPEAMRTGFRKAVALVDEPDVSYLHFRKVADQLHAGAIANPKVRVRTARQLSLCAWILFVWARGAGNVEAAYKAVELALLLAWDLRRGIAKPNSKEGKAVATAIAQIAHLHVRTASEMLDGKIFPMTDVSDGLSISVRSSASIDLNLALFETLGRIGLYGLWLSHMSERAEGDLRTGLEANAQKAFAAGGAMVANNPALLLPARDSQAIDIALFLQLGLVLDADMSPIRPWLEHMIGRLAFTFRTRQNYPISSDDYRDLVDLPGRDKEEAFKDLTRGSILAPTLALWARPFGLTDELKMLSEVLAKELAHCTHQLWSPDQTSESHLYLNDAAHGYAIADLPIDADGKALFSIVKSAVERLAPHLDGLSAMEAQFAPIVLVACRHYRLPVPPGFWAGALMTHADIESDRAAPPTDPAAPEA